jgi:hypothetical protein
MKSLLRLEKVTRKCDVSLREQPKANRGDEGEPELAAERGKRGPRAREPAAAHVNQPQSKSQRDDPGQAARKHRARNAESDPYEADSTYESNRDVGQHHGSKSTKAHRSLKHAKGDRA